MRDTALDAAPNVDAGLLRLLESRASATEGGVRIPVLAPFTESEIGTAPAASASDVADAAARARDAQTRWARRSVADRARVLSRFHDLVIDRADTAIDLVQLEAGKARTPAFEEVFDAAATARYYMSTGPKLLKRKRRAVSMPGLTKAWESRRPIGVVGNITPWNFPFTLAVSDMIPALLAGNAVIIKPDERTPYSALYGALLLEEAWLAKDVLQVVTGRGEEAGAALVDQVDFIAFTGSTEVGRTIAERAGRRLIGASLELGGKNAALVLEGADLDRAVPGLSRAVFANSGQLCLAMERIYVHESVKDELTERLVEHTRSLPINTRFDFSSAIGAMIDRRHFQKVDGHVQDAVAKGATLLTGGKPRPDIGPLFYDPTLLTDVDDSMEACRAETFGPVAAIYGYEDVEDAIAEANDSEYGLNFSVWAGDAGRGVEVASRLDAGTVGVNDGYAAVWSSYDAPMGGLKASGVSRRHGAVGILKYTEAQTVAVQRFLHAFAPPSRVPYERYQAVLGALLKALKRLPFYK